MRIVYLSASTIPSRAANSVHVMKMCQAMTDAGHEALLVGRSGDKWAEDDHAAYGVRPCFSILKCRALRSPIGSGALFAWQSTNRAANAGEPDLYYGRAPLSLVAAARRGVPLVYEAHAPPPSPARRMTEAWLFRHANFARLVVISAALRQEYLRLFPWLPEQKIVVAHDGADLATPSPTLPEIGRKAASDRLQVGYVGHLYPGKGMEIVAALAARMPEADFHVVGGTERDIRQWRRQTAAAANLTYYGFVPPARAETYRLAMDVLLAPYQRRVCDAGGTVDIGPWMSPLKIFEYMAAPAAIVASDLPVLREVIRHQREALLVVHDDVSAWQAAIGRLANPLLRRQLAGQALETLKQQFTWKRRAEKVLAGLPSETSCDRVTERPA